MCPAEPPDPEVPMMISRIAVRKAVGLLTNFGNGAIGHSVHPRDDSLAYLEPYTSGNTRARVSVSV